MRFPTTSEIANVGLGALASAGLTSHAIPIKELIEITTPHTESNPRVCNINELEDISGNWAAEEESCGYNLRRVSGEVRVKIAKIEGDLLVSDETLRYIVEDSAEYWNQIMWNIDPTVQFVVDQEWIQVDCDNIRIEDLPNNEVIVCIPSKPQWEDGEGSKESTITGANTISINDIRSYKNEVRNFYTGSSVLELQTDGLVSIVKNAKSSDGIPNYLLPSLVTHEFGHILGLDHNTNKNNNVMGALDLSIIDGEVAELERNEEGILEGLREIYAN